MIYLCDVWGVRGEACINIQYLPVLIKKVECKCTFITYAAFLHSISYILGRTQLTSFCLTAC